MNHDYEHCIDFNDSCPESCFRAQLVRDLEQNYPPSMEVSWMSFGDSPDCQRNRLANSSPKLENENGDTISRQIAIDAILSVGHIAELSDGDAVIRVSAVNYVLRNLPPAHPEPCEDAVSRKAAIDALNEYFVRIGKLKRRGLNEGEKAISLDVVGAIKGLPPATTEQDWIPVNEEMPPLRHDVWLTVFFHEKWNVTEGYRQDGEFMFWNHGRLESALDEENRVTAWKPKSKPYQPDAK